MQRPSTRRPSEMSEINTTSCLAYQLPISSAVIYEGMDGHHIRERLNGFNKMLRQLHMATNKSNDSVQKLSKLQKKMKNDSNKDTASNREKMSALYKSSVKDTETEAELTRQALAAIFDIRGLIRNRQKKLTYGINVQNHLRRGQLMKILTDSAATMSLYIAKSIHEKPPPLCGCIGPEPGYVAKIGDLVAALTRPTPNQEHNWILAEVIHFNSSTNKYEVDDIDEEQKDRHTLSRRKVIPLPTMRANPETDPEALFPKGTIVLALYPQTTCFYKAVVQDPPKTAADNYHLLFEDNGFPEGYSPPLDVPQRYVIVSKEGKSKEGKSKEGKSK